MLPPETMDLWLRICLTVFGCLHALGDVVIKYGNDN